MVTGKQLWNFIWHDDSIWSWLVNIVLAFILIKFIVYPGLGFMLGTSYPIVAVVSGSMHHEGSFDSWWSNAEKQYTPFDISEENFSHFSLRSGFNKGDIIILLGVNAVNSKVGDVIVFQSGRPEPIIHRVVRKFEDEGQTYYQTKGDNYRTNPYSLQQGGIDETKISHDSVKGKALIRIPLLGYIKIIFVDIIQWVIT